MKALSKDGQICLFGNKTYGLEMCFHQNTQSTKRYHIYMSRLNKLCGKICYYGNVINKLLGKGAIMHFFLQNFFEIIKTRIPKLEDWKRYMAVLQR